jgi:hypothetical protein
LIVRKLLILLVLGLFIVPTSSEAAPVSVNCPGTAATNDREFTLTTDPTGGTCHQYGNGANELNANAFDVMLLAGWTLIDKDDALNNDNGFTVTGIGALLGTFTVAPSLWTMWDQIAIGFVVGGGNANHPERDPKWAVFLLPGNETSGSWSTAPREGGELSHGNLYGRDVPGTPVPEPASLLLLGTGLTAVVRRMRAKR